MTVNRYDHNNLDRLASGTALDSYALSCHEVCGEMSAADHSAYLFLARDSVKA
jgi:hypothetical protein